MERGTAGTCATRPDRAGHGPRGVPRRSFSRHRVEDREQLVGGDRLLVAATDLNVSLTAELKSHNASDGGIAIIDGGDADGADAGAACNTVTVT